MGKCWFFFFSFFLLVITKRIGRTTSVRKVTGRSLFRRLSQGILDGSEYGTWSVYKDNENSCPFQLGVLVLACEWFDRRTDQFGRKANLGNGRSVSLDMRWDRGFKFQLALFLSILRFISGKQTGNGLQRLERLEYAKMGQIYVKLVNLIVLIIFNLLSR